MGRGNMWRKKPTSSGIIPPGPARGYHYTVDIMDAIVYTISIT